MDKPTSRLKYTPGVQFASGVARIYFRAQVRATGGRRGFDPAHHVELTVLSMITFGQGGVKAG